jgi:selenocysteine-specific translation elongation factor
MTSNAQWKRKLDRVIRVNNEMSQKYFDVLKQLKFSEDDLKRLNKKLGDAYCEMPKELIGMELKDAVRKMAINNAAYEEGFVGEDQARFDGIMKTICECRKWAEDNTDMGGDMPYGQFLRFLDKLAEDASK